MTPQVRCQAIVDPMDLTLPGFTITKADDKAWKVTVVGQPPHSERRIYFVTKPTDNEAAREGIDRFVREMGDGQRGGFSLLR